MNFQSFSSGVFMIASLLLTVNSSRLELHFKELALAIAFFHIYELVLFKMDKPHKIHHYIVVVTEAFAICFYTTKAEYILSALNSIPLGSNMLSHARKVNPTYDMPYFACYIILKSTVIMVHYYQLFAFFDGISHHGKVGSCLLCGIHATQVYFTLSIIHILLRKQMHLVLLACLLCTSGFSWFLIEMTSNNMKASPAIIWRTFDETP
jgi:hypothetical protein